MAYLLAPKLRIAHRKGKLLAVEPVRLPLGHRALAKAL
jgi:hypothetical protein